MKQLSFAVNEFSKKPKQIRQEKFLLKISVVVSWARLLSVIEPQYPKAENGCRPYELSNWFGCTDAVMEEALHEVPLLH